MSDKTKRSQRIPSNLTLDFLDYMRYLYHRKQYQAYAFMAEPQNCGRYHHNDALSIIPLTYLNPFPDLTCWQ